MIAIISIDLVSSATCQHYLYHQPRICTQRRERVEREVWVESSYGDCMEACAWYAKPFILFLLNFCSLPLHTFAFARTCFLDYVPTHQFFYLYPLEVGAAYSRL